MFTLYFTKTLLNVINKSLKREIHCYDTCAAYSKHPVATTAVYIGCKFGSIHENSVIENLFSRLHIYII
jgi:hypothetical protein